ncbi:hypothetical protein MKW92_026445 [Papaver armeniacum]|nr:hypothetical protein MKW92_026445 [Papaver armeniacum]
MSLSLLQPSFFMSKTGSYAYILIGFQLFLIYDGYSFKSWVAPPDLQQGGNSRILYVHVLSFFLLTKHPLFLRSSEPVLRNRCFFCVLYLSDRSFLGRPMWGTFGSGCSFNFCTHLVPYLPGCIAVGPIDIPIIKFSVNLVEYIASTY